ncbi:hypothetical protein PAXRUDRAFT_835377 [Paxillus rubicundulus Ve08.2h10]|uniref:DUF6533 domain-containing protein n=1 Tax=Paxillus rubicundulus Ve08.2h10 TaxID=930991 RepID=A0A0D0D7V6_9AGAM|nr:hypothetical protein PAXRUDRAFT_835377 [Paxillus rubicundulus Ve08.2h10]
MSSLDTALDNLQMLDYMNVAGAVAVFYDYVLTFSCEVDLIWGKSWSTMTILFIAARYLGLSLAIVLGNGIFYISQPVSIAMFYIIEWGRLIYIFVTEAIMILRVAVMFNDPERTTRILTFLYLLVVIEQFIIYFLWAGPHSGLILTVVTLRGHTTYTAQLGRGLMFPVYGAIPLDTFDLLILVLSLYRFVVHSIETRKMLGRTKVNIYMRLLFEHSVLYFVLNLAGKALADGTVRSPSMAYSALAITYNFTIPYVLFPRLVLAFKGHRWESNGLYMASAPPQHSSSHSPPAPCGSPRGEEYELTDVESPGPSRIPRST